MQRPDSYEELQRCWSVGRSAGIEEGARQGVRKAVQFVSEEGLPCDNVLVIGPQHGFELLEFRDQGFGRILGLDVVPSFCDDCRGLGFECLESTVEELPELDGRWNVYASHSLEHCYDIRKAIERITAICDHWLYAVVPIESGNVSAGHCSPIRNPEHLLGLFAMDDWQLLFQEYEASSDKAGLGFLTTLWKRVRL